MTIEAECPCGKRFRALPELAGKRVKCPRCGQHFVVPAPQSDDLFELLSDTYPGHEQLPTSSMRETAGPTWKRPVRRRRTNFLPWLLGGVGVTVALPIFIVAAYYAATYLSRDELERELRKQGYKPSSIGMQGQGFTIAMPKPYSEFTRRQYSPSGTITSTAFVSKRGEQGAFLFEFTRIEQEPRTFLLHRQFRISDEVLDAIQQQLCSSQNAYNVRVEDLNQGNLRGREIRYQGTIEQEAIEGHIRIYSNQNRVYLMGWMGIPNAEPETEAQQYLDSFRIQ